MDDLFFWALFGIGAGVFLFYRGFSEYRKKRIMDETPTSKIRSMAMGLVEIQGQAAPCVPLTAPFSAKPCVYYRYLVEEYRSSGKNSRWVTLSKSDSQQTPFYVSDGTGQILVAPLGAEIDLSTDFVLRTSAFQEIPVHVAAFLESRDIQYRGFFGTARTLRFTEHHIAPADSVYVMGVCQKTNQNLAAEYKDKVLEVVRKVKANPQVMAQFDTNQDGQISAEEWELARQSIEHRVRDSMQTPENPAFIGKGSQRGEMFYISDANEKMLRSRISTLAALRIFGGSLLSVVSLWYVLAQIF